MSYEVAHCALFTVYIFNNYAEDKRALARRLSRSTCGLFHGQTRGRKSVLRVKREKVHVVPDAKFLVERPAVGEGLFTGIVYACEVAASWRATPRLYGGTLGKLLDRKKGGRKVGIKLSFS